MPRRDAQVNARDLAPRAVKSWIIDDLQSDDFSSGSAGWRINKAGDAEFNNVTVRGTLGVGSIVGALTMLSSTTGEIVYETADGSWVVGRNKASFVMRWLNTTGGTVATLSQSSDDMDLAVQGSLGTLELGAGTVDIKDSTGRVGLRVTQIGAGSSFNPVRLYVNNTLSQVTVGTTGTGGAGFRVLRVPD